MTSSNEIKDIASRLGADACGIANIERFSGSPEGFNPKDVYENCNSVIVFLKKMPDESVMPKNPVPYTHTAYLIYSELDRIGLALCQQLENSGIYAVPVPTDTPYLFWDAKRMHGMGIISLRHAAYLAGLGFLGRNTLLINKDFGNMVYIGAVLTSAKLDPSPLVEDQKCPPKCKICLESCPSSALNGTTVNQMLCCKTSFIKTERGFDIYTCNACRRMCPLRTGMAKVSSFN